MHHQRTEPICRTWNGDWEEELRDISWAALHKVSEALAMGQGGEEEMKNHVLTKHFQPIPIPSLESVNKNLQMEHISQDSNFQWSPAVFRLKVFKSLGKAGKVSLDGFSTGICKLLSQPHSISHVIPQLGVLFLVLPHLWKHNTLLKKHSSNATPGSSDIPKKNYFFLALSLNSILILSPINIYFIWVYIRNIDKYKNICMLYIDFIHFFVFLPVCTKLKSPEHRDYLFLHLCSSSSYAQKKIRERHHITMLCK